MAIQTGDIRNPSDRNKLILAGVLGIVAIVFLWWALIGFGGSGNTPTRPVAQASPTTSRQTNPPPGKPVTELPPHEDDLRPLPANYNPVGAPEAQRNIFVYYQPPVKKVEPVATPTPTPTPTPPVLLANISPSNVFARTSDFTLEVAGDKFTSQLRVVVDNAELPTRYIGPQQLSTTVPAALIANAGSRQIILRSPDGKLYSNNATLTVNQPPLPNYTYIGILGTIHHLDTAILQDKNNKDTLNVQRGDLLGGRFRVTSISEKEVVVVDNNLKIKHTLPMTTTGERGVPSARPTPKVDSEDDEP